MVERVGAFVHSGWLSWDGIGHFPLLGGLGDDGPGADSPGIGVKGDDVDALDAAFVNGGADVVATSADG